MRVIITGGSGTIGSSLIDVLCEGDFQVIVLTRNPERVTAQFASKHVQAVRWDARSSEGWGHLITPDTAIVNLAGESPAHWRWTAAHKRRVLDSRINASQAVMQAIRQYGSPQVVIQASASGYYGDRGDEILAESSAPGAGFRADVCKQWEAVTESVEARRCVIRTGIALYRHGGAFPPLLRLAQWGGKRLGSGDQWIPWIHLRDVARTIRFLIEEDALSGVFNVSAPTPVTNRTFIALLSRMIRRPALLTIPAAALKLALGEMADVVLASQRMLPRRLEAAGFQFQFPDLESAVIDLVG